MLRQLTLFNCNQLSAQSSHTRECSSPGSPSPSSPSSSSPSTLCESQVLPPNVAQGTGFSPVQPRVIPFPSRSFSGSTTSRISLTLFPCQHSTLVYSSTLIMKYNNTLLPRSMLPVVETSHSECSLSFSRSGCKKSTWVAKNSISRCRVLNPRILVIPIRLKERSFP